MDTTKSIAPSVKISPFNLRRAGLWFSLSVLTGFALIAFGMFIRERVLPPNYHGTYFTSTAPVADFELTAHTGSRVSLSDFRGKLLVLYFGYTFCPDICPTTLYELNQATEILGANAAEVQIAMVSVDPLRDTPEQLAEYVTYFNPNFLGMTGTLEEIAFAATEFGIYFEQHNGTDAIGYLVDHTSSMVVLDRAGNLRLVLPFGTAGADIASDLRNLLKRS